MYREFRPPPHLRSAISCLWTRSGEGGAVRVLPDACTDIVWRAGKGAMVAGPDTAHWLSMTDPGEDIVGVRLLPGAGGAALGLPLEELRDQRVALGELGLDSHEQLAPDVPPQEIIRRLAQLTMSLTMARPPDLAVQAAVVGLIDPRRRVEQLAPELGFSERQLRRRFAVAVGYGPKTLQRILRLRQFLTASAANAANAASDGNATGPAGLADAAAQAGFSDQAHLTRECRRLTGLTPAQLLNL
jgi:AraC-like DNA-binding protein